MASILDEIVSVVLFTLTSKVTIRHGQHGETPTNIGIRTNTSVRFL